MIGTQTYIWRQDSSDVRRSHSRQTPDTVDQCHNGGRVVGRQVERIDTDARIAESHERHANAEASGRQKLITSDERGTHHS